MLLNWFRNNEKHQLQLVCLATISWGFMHQRPQQLMARLTDSYEVLYVNPPRAAERRQLQLLDADTVLNGLQQNVSMLSGGELQLYQPLKLATNEMPDLTPQQLEAVNHYQVTSQLRAVLSHLGWENPLLWLCHPEGGAYVGQFNDAGVIYDCLDSFSDFGWSTSVVAKREEQLLKRADVVLVSSEALLDKHQQQVGDPNSPYLVRNAADYAHFEAGGSPPQDLVGLGRPLLGYIGAVCEWLDFELIKELAAENPEWQLVFIGPKQHGLEVPREGNIHWVGHRAYERLPAYLHLFDAALIPFRETAVTEYADPIKQWEYLAAGKPFVATELPSIVDLPGVVWTAEDRPAFKRHCAELLEVVEDDAQREAIAKRARAAARANDWRDRVEVLHSIINSRFGPG